MIFWSIVIAVTAISCAVLFYAAGRRVVNAPAPQSADPNSHFRQLLVEIDADVASGRIAADQAVLAKKELAREVMRLAEADLKSSGELGRGVLAGGVLAVAVVALGLYAVLGSPDLPAQPLADRPELVAQTIDLDDAIGRIEGRLAQSPEDLRGWTVIAPAYIELGRYADAVAAYRRVIELGGPTADAETALAEALLLSAQGQGSDEAMALLRSAAERDTALVRPRLYIAAELMRAGDYAQAAEWWQQAIDLSAGDEAWLAAAREGLAVAQAGGVDTAAEQQAEMIRGMVGGLAERLAADGGTVEEWMQLVRSYVVLGDLDAAQLAYDASVRAYPAAFDRGELDTLALGAGLTLNGDTP
jgi:cytochrome c-type biogenesis protein CcmH